MPDVPSLIDQHGRRITYIRLSVTDRCDLRCQYCLPARPDFLPKSKVLSLEDLLTIATEFVALGVTKVRITGGEPLIRKDLPWLLERVAALPGVHELTLTTNGTQLAGMAREIKAAGVKRINISLDTLTPTRFAKLTRNGNLAKVLAGIEAAASAGFAGLRINTVLMQGFNDDELVRLVRFAIDHHADISFIEEMPLGGLGRAQVDHRLDSFTTLDKLGTDFDLTPSDHTSGGPARYWNIADCASRVGIIAPHTRNFCTGCNRVRITCTGDLYPCLGQNDVTPLAAAASKGDRQRLRQLIRATMATKPEGHEFSWDGTGHVLRYMATTGG